MNIGDNVKVIDEGEIYTTYYMMFKKMKFKHPELQNKHPLLIKKNVVYKIFAKDVHHIDSEILYGIVNEDGEEILIGEEGIELC